MKQNNPFVKVDEETKFALKKQVKPVFISDEKTPE